MKQFLIQHLFDIILFLMLIFVSAGITFFYLRFGAVPPPPKCADRVAAAFTDIPSRPTVYDECLTTRLQLRYPSREQWIDMLIARWQVYPFITPLDREFSQRVDVDSWNIFYVGIAETPTGAREQSIRLFLDGDKVDLILF